MRCFYSHLFQGPIAKRTFPGDNYFLGADCDSVCLFFDEAGDFDVVLRIIDPNGCIGLGNLENPISTSTVIADFEFTPEEPRIEFNWIQLIDVTKALYIGIGLWMKILFSQFLTH
ncbi:MAG: hypothetical protein ACI81Y_000046 [Glaciecola sp.]|jgi:hypothetical protein